MRLDRIIAIGILAGLFVLTIVWRVSQPPPPPPVDDNAPTTMPAPNVVVYTSMDQPTAAALFKYISLHNDVRIVPQYDAEASKTTGLASKIRGEKKVPQADLFWSNEPYQMEMLGREGLLAPYDSPLARDLPPAVRPAHHLWTPVTLKPRVIAFQPGTTRHLIEMPASAPTGLEYWMTVGLYKEDQGHWAISNPQFGTTRGQFAMLAAAGGMKTYRHWLQQLADSKVRIVDGNSVAAELVARKVMDFAWTDLDDVLTARANNAVIGLYIPPGRPVLTPAAVGLIARGPNPAPAKIVYDALVSAATEKLLAESDMKLVPLRPDLRERLMLEQPPIWPREVTALDWTAFPDVPKIVDAMPQAMQAAQEVLLH